MERQTFFVDVVLPLALAKLYTYRVPLEFNSDIEVGKRVVVPFKTNKLYSALIKNVHTKAPEHYEAKYIISVLDESQIVGNKEFKLWEWISEYYMCSLGEVMTAALPSALKLESESRIQLNREFEIDKETLNDKEYLIVEALEIQDVLKIKDVSAITGYKNIHKFINKLVQKQIVLIQEDLIEKVKKKIFYSVKLTETYENDEQKQKEIFDELEKKAPKQLQLLMTFYKLMYDGNSKDISKAKLLEESKSSSSILDALVKKGVFNIFEKEERNNAEIVFPKVTLSSVQANALEEIKKSFEEKDVTLLHGITSSGKTEIFVKYIEQCINQDEQVLYLLPEIALTTQLTQRLKVFFGERLVIYHSKLNDRERMEVWTRMHKKNNVQIVLGARSALFLPFHNLGLVIVDEEHEVSYKQFDPAPRYNARDTAIYLASVNKAKTLLASATPSIESFYNASSGKYGLVSITERYGNLSLPEVSTVDLKEQIKKKKMKSHFSSVLFDQMSAAIDQGEQVILFQNRRGFAPLMECNDCGWVPKCIHCDVSLTYHKFSNRLKCHYCGFSQALINTCNACGNSHMELKGFGTEKVAEELELLFPEKRIMRLDADSTRAKNSYQQILQDFEDGQVNILVGTQMISKGLNFSNVSLVGVLNADSLIHFPDFRASERSFQLVTQVSGRAGRKHKQGKVIVQTYSPEGRIIHHIKTHDYISMYNDEIKEREQFKYPPYYRLIQISIKNKDYNLVEEGSTIIADKLKSFLGKRVLGPESPMISRIKTYYIKDILIKVERQSSIAQVKAFISSVIRDFSSIKSNSSFLIQIDVDPL